MSWRGGAKQTAFGNFPEALTLAPQRSRRGSDADQRARLSRHARRNRSEFRSRVEFNCATNSAVRLADESSIRLRLDFKFVQECVGSRKVGQSGFLGHGERRSD